MRLKRLVIQGFKSFRDRTTIHFENGITGIVGPNGCGKSNVVDAIFWVMGEQSAKHLRGQSMQDVIFSGSEKYKPASWAEVTLVLDNNELKHIHIGNSVTNPSEIQLTRKLYRNGESDFRINDIPCRLKDIQEVFMDTGAGAKSYSVIAQGEINKLVQAKPHELRTMIEEVAGITKFKLRKKESLRKIELTQQNLSRLSDLKIEIENNLSSLEKQSEKASKAKNLKEKIKNNELLVYSNKVVNLLKDFKEGKQFKISESAQMEGFIAKLDTLNIEKGKLKIQKDELVEKINAFQIQYNQLSRELATKEERYKNLKEKKHEKEKSISLKKDEMIAIEQEKLDRQSKLSFSEAELLKLESLNDPTINLQSLEHNLQKTKADLDAKKNLLNKEKSLLQEKNNLLVRLEREIIKNDSSLSEFSRQLQSIASEKEELENKYSSFSGQISRDRENANSAQDLYLQLEKEDNLLQATISELEEKFNHLENDLKKVEKELTHLESLEKSLKTLSESYEGFQEGTGLFLKSKYAKNCQPIGRLIQCPEKFTKAIESLMMDVAQTIWTEDLDLDQVFMWFEENKKQGLDLITWLNPCTEILEYQFQEIYPVLDIAKIQSHKLMDIFKGMYIVPHLSVDDIKNLKGKKFKSICTLNGDLLVKNTAQGIIVSMRPKRDGTVALIERNNKILEVADKISIKKEDFNNKNLKYQTVKTELNLLKNKRNSLTSQLVEAKIDFAGKSSSLDTKIKNNETNKTRFENLKTNENKISGLKLHHLEIQENQQRELEQLRTEIETLSLNFKNIEMDLSEVADKYEQEKQGFFEIKVSVGSYEERKKSLIAQTNDLRQQIGRLDSRLKLDLASIEEGSLSLNSILQETELLEKENKELVMILKDKEDVLGLKKDEVLDLEKALNKSDKEINSLASKINSAEKDLAQMDIKLEQYIEEECNLTKNTFEKYQVNVRNVAKIHLDLSDEECKELKDISNILIMETPSGPCEIVQETYEFSKKYPNELKEIEGKLNTFRREYNNLGDINWQSIAEYEKQKVRFDFLKSQETELINSIEDLKKAIEQIDQRSKERFQLAYTEVAEKFAKIFPIVFGGGQAELRLVGDIEDSECGVDIFAQPMGKKTQNISLMSGGEKALTAVSLLFAIFLIKPSPFVLLDEVDAPLDEANVGRFNELLKELSTYSQFILITHNKKTMALNDTLYGITMQEPGVSKCVSVHLH